MKHLECSLDLEEVLTGELRRRVLETKKDLQEAEQQLATMWKAREVDAAPGKALQEELTEALRLERQCAWRLRGQLSEVEEAAVETAEVAEARLIQLEATARGRRIGLGAAEMVAEEEALVDAAAWAAHRATDRVRDELSRALNATLDEGAVADGLRRALRG
eukprot:CAMPEP_0180803608 /NCGR_PEP_ID=MMETSP1038_2-20121128/60991_1 /TAXON_ID=632150 /ORGANISM="Azadinium spinosum, Strain 3D9" /LENGTH=161 /DNA_ID=CAMNT_0022843941 /DNA_START=9 /DNA_END=492 /DNA_ORIENTATION=+